MGKKKKQNPSQGIEKEEALSVPVFHGPCCPLCKREISFSPCFYCPHCGREIDYFLAMGISSVSEQDKEKVEKGLKDIFYSYMIAIAAYVTVWILLTIFILKNCLNLFLKQ